MALSVEGVVNSNNTAASIAATHSNSGTNRRVYAAILTNGGPVTGVAGGSLTWTRLARSAATGANIEVWYADAASQLTSVSITVTVTTGAFNTLCVWSVASSLGTVGHDANGSNPNLGTSGNRTISTDTADAMIFGCFRSASVPTTATTDGTWTGIDANNYLLVQHKTFNSTQSGLSFGMGSGVSNNGSIAFAVIESGGGGPSGNPHYAYAQQ